MVSENRWGHADLATTQRYTHLTPAAVESAIRLLESPQIPVARGDMVETGVTGNRKSQQ
jgi:hypothetical protein